ncbi:riboflavin biosynthesis protein RibF [Candidatus Termititenax persephonae]|uniref:Riboflavin biosynthesis protein n=1 Tax=Candidatus Termititenax persephonae TaxID=2218525 RepID=A0A388TE69_9BACT|nr:riboflavin biosynthesis protein RibF [Candidatus Termititenax persephonae]
MKIAIGVFDGVHRGHQKVIEQAHLVLTIAPHPNPDLELLTTPAEKKDLLGNMAEFKFTPRRARLTPENFIVWLKQKYNPTEIIVGHDFHFGWQRQGNTATLRKLGKKYKIAVTEIPEYVYKKEPVRSSTLRAYLYDGRIARVNELLGRDYQLYGRVVRGKRLGRKLGFPTINLRLAYPRKLVPRDGVYRGEAIVQNKLYTAAIFISGKTIEAHLLNFSGNLYGQKAVLFLQEYLRPIFKFKNLADLAKQIKQDIRQINSCKKTRRALRAGLS